MIGNLSWLAAHLPYYSFSCQLYEKEISRLTGGGVEDEVHIREW